MKSIEKLPYAVVLLFTLLFASLWYRISLHCTSYFDLGIYSDALNRIHWNDLNPFLPGRNINIFNDHFDPILIPFSFLTPLIPAPILGTTVEFLALLLCWFPLRMLKNAGKITEPVLVFSYAFILLNHAIVDAVQTPFHPTTWAALPLMYLFSYYLIGNFKGLIVSLLILFSCREEFPLIGLPLAAVLVLDQKKKEAFITFLISASWIAFVFVLRPRVFGGHFENYGAGLLNHLFTDPADVFKKGFNIGTIRLFLERALPLLLLLSANRIKNNLFNVCKVLLIASPIFVVRFISNQWAFHYGTAAIIALLFIFIESIHGKAGKFRAGFGVAFLVVIFISEPIKTFFNHHPRCPNSSNRLNEISEAQSWLQTSGKQNIILENNLASTQFLKLGKDQNIFLLCSPTGSAIPVYDAVMIEKPTSGDAWPCGYDRIQELMTIWKNSRDIHVITDNEFIFLAEGRITPER